MAVFSEREDFPEASPACEFESPDTDRGSTIRNRNRLNINIKTEKGNCFFEVILPDTSLTRTSFFMGVYEERSGVSIKTISLILAPMLLSALPDIPRRERYDWAVWSTTAIEAEYS
jgi:hypothetical protein